MSEKGLVSAASKNLKSLKKSIESINDQVKKAGQRTVSDMKTRAPTLARKAAQERYNIKASYITKAGKFKKGTSAGAIKLRGTTVENLQLIYKGERLTPALFGMTPKTRNPQRKQTIKIEIIKGKKKKLHPGSFLGKAGGTWQIPYVRETKKRLPIQALYTVAVPQMITNEQVAANIEEGLQALLAERLDHNIKQCTQNMIKALK